MDLKSIVFSSIAAGCATGLVTDTVQFPLDTIKTRLQSADGFLKSGGFRHLYKGFGSILLGSLPYTATFFLSYEVTKYNMCSYVHNLTTIYVAGSLVAEVCHLVVQVPFEVIKQRAQANPHFNSRTAFLYTIKSEGFFGLYCGFTSTLMRDGPLVVGEMVLWETFKNRLHKYKFPVSKECPEHSETFMKIEDELTAVESGFCAGLGGAISAFFTTPLDVGKTRVMLSTKDSILRSLNPFQVVFHIGVTEGFRSLFAGVIPRVAMFSFGSFLGLATYSKVKSYTRNLFETHLN